MRTKGEIKRIADELHQQVMKGMVTYEKESKNLVNLITTEGVDTAFEKFRVMTRNIEAIIKGASCDDVRLPGFTTRFTTNNTNKLIEINFIVSSKPKASYAFKLKRRIAIDENLVESICDTYIECLFNAFYVIEARENVEELNAKLAEIYEEHDVKKCLYFGVDGEAGRVISITDDEIVLNADVNKAMDIPEMHLFLDTTDNEYKQLIYEDAVNAIVDYLGTISITPEITKKRSDFIQSLVDMKSRKAAHKIIRETYHKQAKYVKSERSGITYVDEEIDGIEVFALVEMQDDKTYKTILSPFDVEKLVPVDVDVTKYI